MDKLTVAAVRASLHSTDSTRAAAWNCWSDYGRSRVIILGNALASRMCGRPQIHATVSLESETKAGVHERPVRLRRSRYQLVRADGQLLFMDAMEQLFVGRPRVVIRR